VRGNRDKPWRNPDAEGLIKHSMSASSKGMLCTSFSDDDHRSARGVGPPPPDVTNAASIAVQSIPNGLTLQRATMLSSQAGPNAP
jgi:hypothetical protein